MRAFVAIIVSLLLVYSDFAQQPVPRAASPKNPAKSQSLDSPKPLDAAKMAELQKQIELLQKIKTNPTLADKTLQAAIEAAIVEKQCELNSSVLTSALQESKIDNKLLTQILNQYTTSCKNAPSEKPVAPVPEKISLGACELTDVVVVSTGSHEERKIPQPEKRTRNDAHQVTTITSVNNTGDQVVGPQTINVKYVNPLRYDFSLGSTTTFQNGPQLPTQLVPALSALPAAPTGSKVQPSPGATPTTAQPAVPTGLDETFLELSECYRKFDSSIRNIDISINDAISATNVTTSQFSSVLNRFSSKLLNDGEFSTIRSTVSDDAVFKSYYHFEWPVGKIGALSQQLASFVSRFLKFAQLDGYSDWVKDPGHKQIYDYVQSKSTELQQHLNALAPNSDTANKLRSAQDSVELWRQRFNVVQSMADLDFVPSYDVDCTTWFGKSKTVTVKLLTRDVFTQNANQESSELITVVCNSLLTVSTGIGFNTSGEKTPAFVAGKDKSGNITQVLGYSSESAVQPLYAFQVSGSLLSNKSNSFEIHATTGAAILTSNSAGNVGFLFGPSFSFFRRTFFLTPAFLLQQKTVFIKGFNPGDAQGTLTSPPTQTSWRPAFVTTLTFPLNK